jgi:predicted Zn-dependent peptidase
MKDENHFELFTYPNGLRLIMAPMENTKSVMVLVLVATGSRYEIEKNSGISHFLEHLMFKGTEKRPGTLDISHELDSIGAEYNAFTSKEYTGYYVKCASEKADTALDVISDIFQNSKFEEKEMDKERGPIKEEINMYFDNPASHVSELFDGLIYGDHPLGWNVAGKKEIIDAIQRENVVKYFSTHYFAKSTVVCVAGNIDREAAKEKVARYFNNIREADIIKPIPAVDEQTGPRLKIFNKQTDQTHINLGFRAYGCLHPKLEALDALSFILGGGMSSRLFSEIRVKRGLAYRVGAGTASYNETGDFTIFAGLNNENLIPAVKIILEETQKMTNELVSEGELNRTKDYAKGRLAIGLETSDAWASFYGQQELLENRILTPEEKFAKIMAVTREDILETAKDVLRPGKLNLAIVGPFEEDNPEIKDILNSW